MTIREIVEKWKNGDETDYEGMIADLEIMRRAHHLTTIQQDAKYFWREAFVALLTSWDVNEALERANDATEIYIKEVKKEVLG